MPGREFSCLPKHVQRLPYYLRHILLAEPPGSLLLCQYLTTQYLTLRMELLNSSVAHPSMQAVEFEAQHWLQGTGCHLNFLEA